MRITRLEFKDFRGFHEETLELGEQDTVVFAGPNGSGKSSVLAAVAEFLEFLAMHFPEREYGGHGYQKPLDFSLPLHHRRAGCSAASLTVNATIEEPVQARLMTSDYESVDYHIHDWTDDYGPFVHLSGTAPRATALLPVLVYVHTENPPSAMQTSESDFFTTERFSGRLSAYLGALDHDYSRTADFEPWFEGEENIENEQRIRMRDLDHEHPSLRAVRGAIRRVLTTLRAERLGNLRFERLRVGGPLGKIEARLTIEKDGSPLYLDQLSDGERRLILLVGDVARRMAILNPHLDDPTSSPGVLLADEIDLHLHPGWQRRVMPALRAAFPKVQLMVTTHSPQVLASVPSEAVVMMKDFKFLPGHPKTFGRDTNTLLDTVFEVPERPEEIMAKLKRLYDLLDDHTAEARGIFEELRKTLEHDDPELARIETLLMLAEG